MWFLVAAALAGFGSVAVAPDTDGDGISDQDEDANRNGVVDPGESDPKNPDTDGDNVPDAVERRLGTDPSRADDLPPIPEPLLVDLIRNLGSKRGEVETNVLATSSFQSIEWGSEIEWSPVRNLGLELEVPFRDADISAVKTGAQWTIGSVDVRRLEFGALGTYSHGLASPERRAVVGAITGVRIARTVQALTIVGPTFDFARSRPVPGATLNPSLFVQSSRYVTTGLELGYRVEEGSRSLATMLPQVHLNPFQAVKLQLGAGASIEVGHRVKPLVAIRLSYEL